MINVVELIVQVLAVVTYVLTILLPDGDLHGVLILVQVSALLMELATGGTTQVLALAPPLLRAAAFLAVLVAGYVVFAKSRARSKPALASDRLWRGPGRRR